MAFSFLYTPDLIKNHTAKKEKPVPHKGLPFTDDGEIVFCLTPRRSLSDTFVVGAGTTAKSSEVNSNFTYLANRSWELSGSAYSYGAVLSIYSTGTALNCTNVTVSCFQGITNPKRNLAGYVCQNNSTAGSGGKSIVVGH
ncbi:MAG: hypothetical protein HQK88_09405 [Nitrospirae bacterium]|nr:hypothetical protein [Nitrospirota bacterium]MBF0534128.1 hypothetical protein [Nitrospirota bacterium]MBF0617015.1 hypothetical protein [Nitrospirota bacterium]